MHELIKENKLIAIISTLWLLFGIRVLYVSTQQTVTRGFIEDENTLRSYSDTPSAFDNLPGFMLLFILPVACGWSWKWYHWNKRDGK